MTPNEDEEQGTNNIEGYTRVFWEAYLKEKRQEWKENTTITTLGDFLASKGFWLGKDTTLQDNRSRGL